MEAGAHDEGTLRRYSDAQSRLEHAGGWAWRERATRAARGLGFDDPGLDRQLSTFSGGELTRASLARALAIDPDLLLLDEPTNHLDVESLEWLEAELATLDAAVILVAHDRWFLEAVTTAVLELAPGGAHFFAGPWHEWRREKAARAAAAEKTADRVSEDIARLERFVERFRYKKSKARQAQAKLTQIGRLEKDRAAARGTSIAHPGSTDARLRLPRSAPCGTHRARRREHLAHGRRQAAAGGREHRRRAWREGRPGRAERVGQDDASGGALGAPLAGRGNVASLGHGVVPAYFSQHTQELPAHGSVLDCAVPATGLTRPQAQMLLGRFLFSGWDMHERPVSALSGGERRRLALALLVASGANFLVLDEPTNHLDLESREALEAALEAFPGTVLIVSHDRALLDAVPDRIVAVEERALRSYDGGWADLTRERDAESAPPPEPVKQPRRPSGRPRPVRKAPSELELVETEIATLEARVAELEGKLAEDWANMDVLSAHRAARDELKALLARWELLFEGDGIAVTKR